MSEGSLLVDVKETLRFFDEKPDWAHQQATAVVGMMGEDLSAAALEHCLKSNGFSGVNVRTETVGTGRRAGPRLDRWIEADLPGGRRVLFQTEIKSWSAHAIGGEKLPLDAPPDQVEAYRRRRWQDQWDPENRTLTRPEVTKVLVLMKPTFDTAGREFLPLLIYWHPIGPGDQPDKQDRAEGGHLFSISDPTCRFGFPLPPTWPAPHEFPELWVFSVSSYLRSITASQVELRMPNAARRLQTLTRLFQPAGECNRRS